MPPLLVPELTPTALGAVLAAVLGALVGSFANVVVFRMPRGESVVLPRSRCPACGHALGPHELVPVLSWAVQRGRCRSCAAPVSLRYPLVEALFAALFAAVALRWPLYLADPGLLPLLAVLAMLTMAALIDLDTFVLPDALTLPALALALAAAWLARPGGGLPGPAEAALGAALGAGVLTLVNRLGGLALRRFADTRERLWPIGFDQVGVAALVAAVLGWRAGLLAAGLSVALNLATRRTLRLPEPFVWGLWGLALVLLPWGLAASPFEALGGSLAAAGVAALAGALYWWLAEIVGGAEEEAAEEDDEPVAMGFGDAKLAAALGALLGWQGVLVMLFLSFVAGAAGGVGGRLLGGDRTIPFGPYLLLGGLLALFFGDGLIAWYLGQLGL